MNTILFAAAEASPFIKTGGLADVIGSLPKELIRQGADIRVILPKYDGIPDYWKLRMEHLCHFNVPVGWRQQYCGISSLCQDGVTYYFVDNEYYFKRSNTYGYYDDAERFAFFCRAVLEALPKLDFKPQVIHCHDWHTAVIPLLLHAHYRQEPGYANLHTVLTIHNLHYQGVFPAGVLGDLLDLDEREYLTHDKVEFYGGVNFLKAGIVYSDVITTVSKSYAEEILTPEYGENLDGLLRERKRDLTGIVNGIDYEYYNPANDGVIAAKYTWRSAGRKRQSKLKLQEFLGLPVDVNIPLIGIVTRLVPSKGLDLVAEVLDEVVKLGVQVVVLGTGDEKYVNMFTVAAHHNPDNVSSNIYFEENLAHKIYAGSDMFLMPSLFEPCGIGQMIALRYGSIPVVRETGGLKDTIIPYNEYTGEGNGFVFSRYQGQDMLNAVQRALAVYRNADQWKKVVYSAMRSDYSWGKSAQEYLSLYKRLCG